MAAKSSGGDSKQGLIITLVIFVILTLVFGVTTYLGYFNGDVKLAKDYSDLKAEKQNLDQDADWYKFQAYAFRSYMGQPLSPKEKETYDLHRGKFDQSGMQTRDPEKDTVTKLIKETLDKTYHWDPANKKVGITTADQIADLNRRLETNTKTSEELKKERDQLRTDLDASNKKLAKEVKDNKEALETLRKEMNTELNKWRDQNQDLQNRLNVQGETIATLTTEKNKANTDGQKALNRKEKEIGELKDRLARMEKEQEQQKLDTMQANAKFTRLDNDKPRGEITIVNGGGQMPFINLGSADNVKPGLRFTVHGIDANGKANLEAKATLEVMEVIKPHMSQGRLVAVVNQQSNPVIVGDKLFNPAWDPNRKTHVAISGVVDLSGNKRDGIQEFIQDLKKRGIEVDAYFDLREGEIKGEITRNTDFLILGDTLEESNVRLARDKDRLAAANKKMKEMQDTAIRNGVRPIQLREFQVVTGTIPAVPETPKQDYRSRGASPVRLMP